MKKDQKDKEYKQTQSTSSPGTLGEDVDRDKRNSEKPISKNNTQTSKEEGLNQVNSAGNAGAFEGLENTGDS